LMGQNVPAIYRVHEEPDERRLQEYREEVLSHHVPCANLTRRPEVQRLLQKLGTIPIGAALKIGFLRSLMRARYAVEPLGHYGLAKAKYTHFTTPSAAMPIWWRIARCFKKATARSIRSSRRPIISPTRNAIPLMQSGTA